MATRRAILMTGGAAAVVAMGGAAYNAWAPGAAAASAPWRAAGEGFGDPRLDALAYAILAPNSHNRQPWLFELVNDTQIDVYCDLSRLLPETDPFDRQITIGFGCMLELLRQAAAEKGVAAEIAPFPDGAPQPRLDGRRVARVDFKVDASVARDPLFQESLARRTCRSPFDANRPVSADTLRAVVAAPRNQSSVGGTLASGRRERLITISKRGWEIEYETDATRRESIAVMRIGNRAVVENPDGIALSGAAMGAFKMAGLITPEKLDTPETTAYEQSLTSYSGLIDSAQGFVWIKTDDNIRETQLAAGRDWVRMNLAAQAEGLAIQPLSQALQEFPEMARPYAELREELGAGESGVVQMLARIGYAPFPTPSPRWPLSSRLIDAGA
jgi:nitroreductase